jgi:hypothetical protein
MRRWDVSGGDLGVGKGEGESKRRRVRVRVEIVLRRVSLEATLGVCGEEAQLVAGQEVGRERLL